MPGKRLGDGGGDNRPEGGGLDTAKAEKKLTLRNGIEEIDLTGDTDSDDEEPSPAPRTTTSTKAPAAPTPAPTGKVVTVQDLHRMAVPVGASLSDDVHQRALAFGKGGQMVMTPKQETVNVTVTLWMDGFEVALDCGTEAAVCVGHHMLDFNKLHNYADARWAPFLDQIREYRCPKELDVLVSSTGHVHLEIIDRADRLREEGPVLDLSSKQTVGEGAGKEEAEGAGLPPQSSAGKAESTAGKAPRGGRTLGHSVPREASPSRDGPPSLSTPHPTQLCARSRLLGPPQSDDTKKEDHPPSAAPQETAVAKLRQQLVQCTEDVKRAMDRLNALLLEGESGGSVDSLEGTVRRLQTEQSRIQRELALCLKQRKSDPSPPLGLSSSSAAPPPPSPPNPEREVLSEPEPSVSCVVTPPADEEEKRPDTDGKLYTKKQFFEFYGSYDAWEASARGSSGDEERRVDSDGCLYTKSQFFAHYGSLVKWEAAVRLDHVPLPQRARTRHSDPSVTAAVSGEGGDRDNSPEPEGAPADPAPPLSSPEPVIATPAGSGSTTDEEAIPLPPDYPLFSPRHRFCGYWGQLLAVLHCVRSLRDRTRCLPPECLREVLGWFIPEAPEFDKEMKGDMAVDGHRLYIKRGQGGGVAVVRPEVPLTGPFRVRLIVSGILGRSPHGVRPHVGVLHRGDAGKQLDAMVAAKFLKWGVVNIPELVTADLSGGGVCPRHQRWHSGADGTQAATTGLASHKHPVIDIEISSHTLTVSDSSGGTWSTPLRSSETHGHIVVGVGTFPCCDAALSLYPLDRKAPVPPPVLHGFLITESHVLTLDMDANSTVIELSSAAKDIAIDTLVEVRPDRTAAPAVGIGHDSTALPEHILAKLRILRGEEEKGVEQHAARGGRPRHGQRVAAGRGRTLGTTPQTNAPVTRGGGWCSGCGAGGLDLRPAPRHLGLGPGLYCSNCLSSPKRGKGRGRDAYRKSYT